MTRKGLSLRDFVFVTCGWERKSDGRGEKPERWRKMRIDRVKGREEEAKLRELEGDQEKGRMEGVREGREKDGVAVVDEKGTL